jgi:threonine dehydratase
LSLEAVAAAPTSLAEVRAAASRTAGVLARTPLVRLDVDGPAEIWLKLENLHPTGSFKVRGAGNALLSASPDSLKDDAWTASAGNMALALAWWAQRLGVRVTALVPDDAPEVKLAGVRRLGADIVKVPFAEYQQAQRAGRWEGGRGLLVHPFADPAVMAGNGVIGLEVLEDLPDVDAILAPYGGGGLSCGIAGAVRALRPDLRVYGCELETAAPLAASLAAGRLVETPYAPSFVSGMGAPFVFPQMWPLASRLLAGAPVVTLRQVCDAICVLAERSHVVAEGAAATTVAAAMQGLEGVRKVVCVISGGNLAAHHLAAILQGQIP